MVTVRMPFVGPDGSSAIVEGNVAECPYCGRAVVVANAFVKFQRDAVEILLGVTVSRQQARRFERAVEEGKVEKIRRVAGDIAPEVETVVNQALQTPFRDRALQWTSATLRAFAKMKRGLVDAAAIAGGLAALYELSERFQEHPSEYMEPHRSEEPQKDPPEGEPEIPQDHEPYDVRPHDPNKPIDV